MSIPLDQDEIYRGLSRLHTGITQIIADAARAQGDDTKRMVERVIDRAIFERKEVSQLLLIRDGELGELEKAKRNASEWSAANHRQIAKIKKLREALQLARQSLTGGKSASAVRRSSIRADIAIIDEALAE